MLDICGFCGRLPPCKTSLEFNRKKTVNIKSDCPQFIEFSYGAAAKDASSGSCNVPIMCPLCNISVFKFSLPNHYSIIHKGKEMPSDYKLSEAERERLMRVPLTKANFFSNESSKPNEDYQVELNEIFQYIDDE